MLSAVQIHNNSQVDFKSELFIVTSVIATIGSISNPHAGMLM